jgi:hypothetical protein
VQIFKKPLYQVHLGGPWQGMSIVRKLYYSLPLWENRMGNGLRRIPLTIVLSLVLLFSLYNSTTGRWQTSFGQDEEQDGAPLTVKTDKGTYTTGETVTVDGLVLNPILGETVRLGNVSDSNVRITPDESGHFVKDNLYLFDAYKQPGDYKILVTYTNQTAESEFGVSLPPS